MNLFQLEYFVTLAEMLNYTKASDRLHITQPTLSKFIVNLEHSLGSPLFIRNKRDVKLTQQGKVFYEEIKKTLNVYNNGVTKVRDIEKGITGVLNIGVLGTALLQIFPKLLYSFNQKYPTIKINPLDYTYSKILKTLSNGDIDIALMPDTRDETIDTFKHFELFSDAMCVVVHNDHKYADKNSIRLEEIKDEPFIHMNPKDSIEDTIFINSIFKSAGLTPNTVYEANSLLNMLLMADCKIGYTILALHMSYYASKSLKFIPITGFEDYFKIICAYKDEDNIAIDKFIDVIKEFK